MSVASVRPVRQDTNHDALLADPALVEALADPAGFERLSDEDVRAMRARRRHSRQTVAAAMLVAVVGAGGWWGLRPDMPPARTGHFATARGQHAEIQLADGSALTLDGATSVDVTLASDHRNVSLRAGEAYFDIAHDPARPFTVQAGSSSARVLGTAFDLSLTHDRVELEVYRGAVRFGQAKPAENDKVVRAGWRSSFAGGDATEPSRFDVTREGWRHGWLYTDGMPLGEVVEALNRQGGPLIQSPPVALADIRIAGRFRLDDQTALLTAIGDAYGFVVRRDETGLRLEPAAKP